MRSSFAAGLAAVAFVAATSMPAAAAPAGGLRDAVRGIAEAGAAGVHLARAVIDGEARPRRSSRRYDRTKRRAKPAHARAAKRARKHTRRHARRHRGHALRQTGRTGRRAVRAQHRIRIAAVPAAGGRTGIASYYGRRFHGRLTASGTRFNQNGLTAAHRTLPFGTRVRVTHLGTGRSVDVRINDRGPYVAGRIIDLSRGAAGVIGMHHQGVARVRVTVLGR